MRELMIKNAQERWKMAYSRYLIRNETIADYDIKMMKTITNALHKNVKNYLEPHEKYQKAILERNPGEILCYRFGCCKSQYDGKVGQLFSSISIRSRSQCREHISR